MISKRFNERVWRVAMRGAPCVRCNVGRLLLLALSIVLGSGPALSLNVSYQLDEQNRLLDVRDGEQRVVQYHYDAKGNLQAVLSASVDTDGDGIADGVDRDDDGDGMDDEWESQYGLDPLNGSDAGFDADGDGRTNAREYVEQTDPRVRDEAVYARVPYPLWSAVLLALGLGWFARCGRRLAMGGDQ